MKIKELVHFSKENYFNGAVQTEWFYDPKRVGTIAESYVFHGPKYYGVSDKDISHTEHRLIDTASFAKNIADKIYSSKPNNDFVMTIAGYGTGKSHLAVCLGALFSGEAKLAKAITENISQADADIGSYIKHTNSRKNLVIVLNGMSNFNLDSEILRCARLSLQQNGINDDVLHNVTKSYDIAKHFVEMNFAIREKQFNKIAIENGISLQGLELKKFLLSHVESNSSALEMINRIYEDVNGDSIHWDRGISAGDILTLLQKELCGENKPYYKILILFDEFGRYIEYAAANPAIAGEASLQQIFEAIQEANGNVIFTGFIQNDLSAYLSRIEKTANIIRYVGRYECSEKLYLSSNFETILANLLKKNENVGFDKIVECALDRYENFHTKMSDALQRWDRSAQKKSVWTSPTLYRSVILKGCYPLHPITVWMLSNTSSWMQQRSTIAFASEMFENISGSSIEGNWLPYVYPIDIIDSSIYNEMLNSEEKGLVQSQFCMLYRDIIMKVGNKLSNEELKVVKAILLINIGKFVSRDKDDALLAIRYCTNLRDEDISKALKSLEDMHGVVAYDDNARTFDLIAEASGFNEFKRVYAKYRFGTSATIDDCGSDFLKELAITNEIETSFAQQHNISSSEWSFEQKLISSKNIDTNYLASYIRNTATNYSGESPRGRLIYAYCNEPSQTEIKRLSALYRELQIEKYPLIILFLDDVECEITDALTVKKAIDKFSVADRERFAKHISGQIRAQNKKICTKFTQLVAKREMVGSTGLITYNFRLNALCSNLFGSLYTSAPAFAFDGFQNKVTTQAKKYLSNICIKLFDRTLMNVQSYQALTQDEKNRIKSCLSIGVSTSWKVFTNGCTLTEPQEEIIRRIYEEVDAKLNDTEAKSIGSLVGEYTVAPYGMNINAIALFMFYFMAQHGNGLHCFYAQEKLSASHVSDKIFKQSKLQQNELMKIRLQMNANAEVDIIAQICDEALGCTLIESCGHIKSKLDAAVQQEGVTLENQSLVAQAKMRLDEGLKLLHKINDGIYKSQELIDDARQHLIIHKFIKVFDYIYDLSKPLSEEYPFICSDVLKAKMLAVQTNVDSILHGKYSVTLSSFKCNITQLSQVKLLYKKVAETLESHGYHELSITTVDRISGLENELLTKQKYEASFVEMEKDLAMCTSISMYGYRESIDMQKKMIAWRTFTENAKDLPSSISLPLFSRLETAIMALTKRQEKLQSAFYAAIEDVNTSGSLDDLYVAESTLHTLEAQDYTPDMVKELNVKLVDIQSVKDSISRMPTSLDELLNYSVGDVAFGKKVMLSVIKESVDQAQVKQNKWVERFVIPAETNFQEMSASDCTNWIERTKIIPDYISASTLERYESARRAIESRLHTCRVEGVVSMFNKLSDAEKKECLKLITRY